MRYLLKFLFPVSYPLAIIWHAILGTFVVGICIMIFDWGIDYVEGIVGAVLGIITGWCLYVLFGEEL